MAERALRRRACGTDATSRKSGVVARLSTVPARPNVRRWILVRAGGDDRSSAPKIDLSSYDVGHGKPLAGTVVNLAGRHLDLLLVSSDGQVYRLDARMQPGGETATFSVPITPDAASIEALQMLLAIASPKTPPALEGFKAGAASDILPRLRSQLPDATATLDVEFFKLVK